MLQPESFEPESTTVWDFPQRGTWATHQSNYRGNFAPQVPRNLILAYTQEGDLVLDPMMGSGTTLIEARLLHRNAIGYDINEAALAITEERLGFDYDTHALQRVQLGDARALRDVAHDSIDLIVTHPPYLNIVQYSEGQNPNDLSSIAKIPKFLIELQKVIHELYRVLKPDHHCAILIGDTRKRQHYIPLSFFLLQIALQRGFVLKEQIIKTQHNTKYGERWRGSSKKFGFYLIMHEHLFVFRKPRYDEKLTPVRYSTWLGGLERNNRADDLV